MPWISKTAFITVPYAASDFVRWSESYQGPQHWADHISRAKARARARARTKSQGQTLLIHSCESSPRFIYTFMTSNSSCRDIVLTKDLYSSLFMHIIFHTRLRLPSVKTERYHPYQRPTTRPDTPVDRSGQNVTSTSSNYTPRNERVRVSINRRENARRV